MEVYDDISIMTSLPISENASSIVLFVAISLTFSGYQTPEITLITQDRDTKPVHKQVSIREIFKPIPFCYLLCLDKVKYPVL